MFQEGTAAVAPQSVDQLMQSKPNVGKAQYVPAIAAANSSEQADGNALQNP